jgi:hypothetical protein
MNNGASAMNKPLNEVPYLTNLKFSSVRHYHVRTFEKMKRQAELARSGRNDLVYAYDYKLCKEQFRKNIAAFRSAPAYPLPK